MLTPVLVLALFAAWRVAAVTVHDVTLQPDSGVYLGTADNIRAGRGPTVPFTMVWDDFDPARARSFGRSVPSTHFPPGYPAALAATSVVSGGTRSAARVLGIVCIFANVMLLGALTARLTSFRSYVAPCIPPLLCVFVADTRPRVFEGPGWFLSHTAVASEPLFMVAFTATILVLSAAITSPSRGMRLVVAGGALAAVALLTRYTGVTLLLLGAIMFLFVDRRRLQSRLTRAGLFLAIAAVPTVAFVLGAARRSKAGARPFAYHPLTGNMQRILEWFGRFLFPASWTPWVRTAALLVVVTIIVATTLWSRSRAVLWQDDERACVLLICSLLGVWLFLDVVMASRSFFDAEVPIDARMLAPVRRRLSRGRRRGLLPSARGVHA